MNSPRRDTATYRQSEYSYLWADTLVTDAWEAFANSGNVFDEEIAARLHEFVFITGNQQEPDVAYRAFRDRDPGVNALMCKRDFPA